MSLDQIILFSLLLLVFAGLVWGRWRYDLVAFAALVVALIAGVVPLEQGSPASAIRRPWWSRWC